MLRYTIPFDQIKTKKVLLQVPEGLVTKVDQISEEFKKRDFEVYISCDPCFGACDLKFLEECTTIHFGHEEFYKTENVIYVPVYEDFDKKWLTETLKKYDGDYVIYTTVQFYEELKKLGFDPIKSLGCKVKRIENKKPLFVGTGIFHPRGLCWLLKKDVICIDPVSKNVFNVKYIDLYKESEIRKFKAFECKKFGIIVSTKPGQKDLKKAEELKKICDGDILIMENISPDRLDYLPYDGFVITACPRIVIDDWKNFKKPVLLPSEFLNIIRKRSSENYI